MRAFFGSTWEFCCGLLKRAYYFVFAFFFDPADLYGKYLVPLGFPEMNLPPLIGWVIFCTLIFLAAALTYHELRQKVPLESEPDWSVGDLFFYLITAARWPERFNDYETWFKGTHQAFHDRAALGELTVWGRPRVDWATGFVGGKNPMQKIPVSEWINGTELDSIKLIHSYTNGTPAETSEAKLIDRGDYVELYVNKRRAKTIWPEKPWWLQLIRPPRFWFLNDVDTEIAFAQAQKAREKQNGEHTDN